MILPDTPLIIAFVGDLYFTSRIESVAQNLGFQVTCIDRVEQLTSTVSVALDPQLKDGLGGQVPEVLDFITRLHPVLIIFDLNNGEIPWRDWIVLIKTSPATRRSSNWARVAARSSRRRASSRRFPSSADRAFSSAGRSPSKRTNPHTHSDLFLQTIFLLLSAQCSTGPLNALFVLIIHTKRPVCQ